MRKALLLSFFVVILAFLTGCDSSEEGKEPCPQQTNDKEMAIDSALSWVSNAYEIAGYTNAPAERGIEDMAQLAEAEFIQESLEFVKEDTAYQYVCGVFVFEHMAAIMWEALDATADRKFYMDAPQ